MTKKPQDASIEVLELQQETLQVCILGTTPLIFNRMAEKAKRELLMPARKNRAAQHAGLKHDPVVEFRNSVYRLQDPKGATALAFPAPGFKAAMAQAAIDIPGSASKAAIGRLCRVMGYSIPIYGIPKVFMTAVRSAGMNKTPDIRTRAIVPAWAGVLQVNYAVPMLNASAVSNLLAAAGAIVGVGDFRQEKGKGDFGLFELVAADDKRFNAIIKSAARAEQEAALEAADAYDDESAELLEWFEAEIQVRGTKRAAA